MRAKVIVLAGPSGSGKSRLCRRFTDDLGLPTVNLDDFYKDGSDPTLPRVSIGHGRRMVDWDDPSAWLCDEAVETLARLCRHGVADVPTYDLAHDGRTGHRPVALGDAPYVVAEGIFAQEVVAGCRSRGILGDALCVRNHPALTFWRRLTRDLREHRKPPLVLLRRGLLLWRAEPAVVNHAVDLGCVPLRPQQGYERVTALVRGTPPPELRRPAQRRE